MTAFEITEETPMVFVLERFPRTMAVFGRLGVCCVTDENMNCTVGELCRAAGEDAGLFLQLLRVTAESV